MAKPKAQTLQMRLGFLDEDRKNPTHDEIAKWLYRIVDSQLANWVGYSEEWDEEDVIFGKQMGYYGKPKQEAKTKSDVLKLDIPPKPCLEIVSKTMEKGMKNGKDYLVGFVDFVVCYKIPQLCFTSNTGDLSDWPEKETVFFEIKASKIGSLGELLRQIRMYQGCTSRKDRKRWFVVAPDANPEDIQILREQGIGFIKYNP